MEDNLYSQVVKETGLPKDLIGEELQLLLKKAGVNQESLTLDQLREIVSSYLQEVLLKVKDEYSPTE